VGMRREKTGIGRKERKEGAECVVRRERQLSTCGMDVGSEMRERERKGTRKNMNEDKIEERDTYGRGERMEIERGGKGRVSFSCFCFLNDGTIEVIFCECF
jgi:hypothetical protein